MIARFLHPGIKARPMKTVHDPKASIFPSRVRSSPLSHRAGLRLDSSIKPAQTSRPSNQALTRLNFSPTIQPSPERGK